MKDRRFTIFIVGLLLAVALQLSIVAVVGAQGATITVTSDGDGAGADDGDCTLREAIINANNDDQSGSTDCATGSGADTITFADDYTIDVSFDEISISEEVTIDGGASTIVIDAANDNRIFNITAGPVTLKNLQLQNGSADSSGGAIYATADITITNSDFFTNTANAGSTGGGGALYLGSGGAASIANSNFIYNKTNQWGGAIHTGPGAITVTNSSFAYNEASHGGAMHIGDGNDNGMGIVTNTTIYSNTTTGTGGGVRIGTGASASFYNSTVAGNDGSDGGGLSEVGTPTFHLVNTIIANNTGSDDCVSTSGVDDDVNNLIETNTGCGSPAVIDDPKLGALQYTGLGGTGVLPLQVGSPAINAGDPTSAPATDQRGVARGAKPDIGAYEYAPSEPIPTLSEWGIIAFLGLLGGYAVRRLRRRK